MIRRMVWLLFLFVCVPAIAQEPVAPVVRWPVTTPTVTPAVDPEPSPKPVTTLPADYLFIVETDVPYIPLTEPEGLLIVSEDEGPVKVRGKIAGGTGRIEGRTYTGKYVYTFEGIANGSVAILMIPKGLQDRAQVDRRFLKITGFGPQPPPEPVEPDVDPDVEPPVDPKTTGPLKIVIFEETVDRGSLPETQTDALLSTIWREYAREHCSKTNGHPDFRVIDKDTNLSKAEDWVQAAGKKERNGLPWLCVTNGTTGYNGPFPEDLERLMQILKEYGGE